jgi:hypothetical protein
MKTKPILRFLLAAFLLSLPTAAVADEPQAEQDMPARAAAAKPAESARLTTDGEELAKALRLMHWSAEKAAAETVPVEAPSGAASDTQANLPFLFLSKNKTQASIEPPVPQGSVWMNFSKSRARGPFEQVYPLIW